MVPFGIDSSVSLGSFVGYEFIYLCVSNLVNWLHWIGHLTASVDWNSCVGVWYNSLCSGPTMYYVTNVILSASQWEAKSGVMCLVC